jgi:hypothetical protein
MVSSFGFEMIGNGPSRVTTGRARVAARDPVDRYHIIGK